MSHNGCTACNFDLLGHGFLLLTCSIGPMECSTGNSYQAEALTNVLRLLNCFLHGRFWQFVYKENVRYTRLMQRSLQVVIRQMFVPCSLKIEAQWSEPMSFTFHSALRKPNTDRTFYRCFPPKFGSFG